MNSWDFYKLASQYYYKELYNTKYDFHDTFTWGTKMHHLKRRTIPFTSIVGQEDMKFALILNAINPRIGGVLIRGDKGTAKSTAVRALADLLESVAVVEDCPFNCDPANLEEMCDLCFEKSETGRIKETSRKTPLIDLPLGDTEDRVVGSLNVERAIKEGIKALEPGILALMRRETPSSG